MSNIKAFMDTKSNILKLNHYWENSNKIILKKVNDSGFDISIEDNGKFILLSTDNGYRFHLEVKNFKSTEDALSQMCALVRDLLSKNMRIKILLKNKKPKKWILEYYEDSSWHEERVIGSIGLGIINIFSKKTQKIYSNDILPPRTFGTKYSSY